MRYPDIYFHPNYAKAHEGLEGGESVHFLHESKYGVVSYVFIKRSIESSIQLDAPCCDIITPYGYGGPIVIDSVDINHTDLISAFIDDFTNYCNRNHVVSEFIRFHPIESNHKHLDTYYTIRPIKKTLATNLVDFGDPFLSEFSKKCRKTIEKCSSLGMTFSIVNSDAGLDAFLAIYKATMDRNKALEFYYFDDSYFKKLLSLFTDNAFIGIITYNDKPIAAGLFFHFGHYVHAHLSGTLPEFIPLSPAYLLRAEVVRWASAHGFRMMHHGGGYTNSEIDGLYKFKKAFAQRTEFDFFIGQRIWNQNIYDELTRNVCKSSPTISGFFPAYRDRT